MKNEPEPSPLKNWKVLIPMTIYFIVWIALAIKPLYRPQWLLENYLVFLLWGVLAVSFMKYRLSALSYNLIFLFLTLHSFGAHYGYCDVPFGFWLSKYFVSARANSYDRLVHFLFGLLLTYPLFEILKRYTKLSYAWALLLPSEFILSYSAIYELIEAATAWTLPAKDYDPFVGLQGDIWDGYKDMLLAFSGSLIITITHSLTILYRKLKRE